MLHLSADNVTWNDAIYLKFVTAGYKEKEIKMSADFKGGDLTLRDGIYVDVHQIQGKKATLFDPNVLFVDDIKTTFDMTVSNKGKLTSDLIVNMGLSLDPTKAFTMYYGHGVDVNVTLSGGAEWKGDVKSITEKHLLPENVRNVHNISLDNASWTGSVYNTGTGTNSVDLNGGSEWNGNIETLELNGKESSVKNTVSLDSASWTGAVTATNDNTAITLANSSTWTVNAYSMVNSVNSDATSNVNLSRGAGIGFDEGTSAISALSFEDDSYIQMNEGAKVAVSSYTGAADVYFETLDNTILKIEAAGDKAEGVSITVAGEANDGNAQEKLQKAYSGVDAVVEVEQGFITDGWTGTVTNGEVITKEQQRNRNLKSVAETTALTMIQWRTEADDLNQRMGELRTSEAANGLWVRTYGGKAEATLAENEFYGFQFGYDHAVNAGADKTFVGGALSYTKGDASFANGTGDNYILGLTGYGTWILENGSYLDLSARYGKLSSDFDLNAGTLGKLNGSFETHGLAVSVEAGHRFPVASLFYVEPQLAFTASHIFGETFGAGQGVTVDQDSINSYVARAGIAAGIKCPDNMGSVWMKASYLYDFDGETNTTATQDKLKNSYAQDFGGSWYELGLGATVNFSKNLFGYADFEYAAGGEIETPWKYNVGVRYVY